MSEHNRPVKRRRIASQNESTTPSKSIEVRRRTISHHRNDGNEGDKVAESMVRMKKHGMTSSGQSPSKKSNNRQSGKKIIERPVSDDESDELGKQTSEESEDEPRKSSRQRKPSAKLVFIQKDNELSEKPRNNDRSRNVNVITKSAEKVITSDFRKTTPAKVIKPAKSIQSTPSETARSRGGPPKNASLVEQEDEEASSSRLDLPVETPTKRGRPQSTAKKLADSSRLTSTPKTLRFDVPTTEPNGNNEHGGPNSDVEMVDDVDELQDTKTAVQQRAFAAKLLSKFGDGKYPMAALRKIVLEKLAQRRSIPLTHLDDEYSKVHTLLESTITAGEGNSMLVVGARGSGKTALVNKALYELLKVQKEAFHVVRLSGFIQTDDKLALREIWRQLGREMETDEDVTKSYADTLTMLLALLSHPEEISGRSADQVAKSIIIVMDEFDLFATHARQTLLYNLLDIAQSRKAPIAVIGLTTKFDVTERLEKRVKSRFSHRYVHLPLQKNLRAFQDVCRAAMSIDGKELSYDEQMEILQDFEATRQKGQLNRRNLPDCLEAWNASVNSLFLEDDFNRAYVRNVYHLNKSVPAVLTSLLMPLSTLPAYDPSKCKTLMPVEHFLAFGADSHLLPPTSSLALILPSLTELQLSLLIAAARLDVIHDSDTCSFGMAYAQYVELSSKARLHSAAAGALATGAGARVWGRDVARGEWEVLIKRGLLLPMSESGGAGSIASAGGLVKIDVRLEEISGAVKGMSSVMERWCKQI